MGIPFRVKTSRKKRAWGGVGAVVTVNVCIAAFIVAAWREDNKPDHHAD